MSVFKDIQNLGIVRSYIYPTFWLFLLPAFSLWFYAHAKSLYDNDFIEANVTRIERS